MKTFDIDGHSISLALFIDVANSSWEYASKKLLAQISSGWDVAACYVGLKELLEALQSGTQDPEFALLNASLIPDVFPVLAAAHKTLISKSRDSLTTRTLHSELVYNCSGSKHITESLRRCGISENSTYVLAARFDATPDEMVAVNNLVIGKEIDLEELEGRANLAQIQKQYKIPSVELGISSLADAITCRIAARDAL